MGAEGGGNFTVRGQLKCDGTRAETRFRLSAKRTSPFKSAGGRKGKVRRKGKGKSDPLTGLDRPRGFQEVKVPRLHHNGTGWW